MSRQTKQSRDQFKRRRASTTSTSTMDGIVGQASNAAERTDLGLYVYDQAAARLQDWGGH